MIFATKREWLALIILGIAAYLVYLKTGSLYLAIGAFVASFVAMSRFRFWQRGGMIGWLKR